MHNPYVYQDGDRSQCLTQYTSSEQIGLEECTGSKLQEFKYIDTLGWLTLPGLNYKNSCATYDNPTIKMKECSKGDTNQMWVYYRNQFVLSKDSNVKLLGGKRFAQRHQMPYLYNEKAIILQGSPQRYSPYCLVNNGDNTVSIDYCQVGLESNSKQAWTIDETYCVESQVYGNRRRCVKKGKRESQHGRIRSSFGGCLTREKDLKTQGIRLIVTDECDNADEWHWRDGSLYLDSDEEYLIEVPKVLIGVAPVLGYIPNERIRLPKQRWIVMTERENDRFKDEYGIRVVNEAHVPIECALKHLGPLYWGVIYPGEVFYRNTGAVWWTLACKPVYDGKGVIRVGEAIWPVADLVVAIIVTIATAGVFTAGTAAHTAASIAVNAVAGATMSAIQNESFLSFVETLAINLAIGGVFNKFGVDDVIQKLAVKSVGSTTSLAKEAFEQTVGFTSGDLASRGVTEAKAWVVNSPSIQSVSMDGVYADGIEYIIKGGLMFEFIENIGPQMTISPLRFEFPPGDGRKMAFGSCSTDGDCLTGECGYMKRGDDKEVCCFGPTGSYGIVEHYCVGGTESGKACWFDEQCENSGYCKILDGDDKCSDPHENGEDCMNNNECKSQFCDPTNGTGISNRHSSKRTCQPKVITGEKCYHEEQCYSGACAKMNDSDSDPLVCCPNSDTYGWGIDLCAKYLTHDSECSDDDQCMSELCLNGKCLGPFKVGESCDYKTPWDFLSNDDLCLAGECGREEAGGSYVCCQNEAIEHMFGEVCNMLEDHKKCELNVNCKSGFCANNLGGVQVGTCITRGSAQVGENCYQSAQACANNMECGKRSRDDDTYVCCEHGTGNWGVDQYCRKSLELGEQCHFDDQCKSGDCATFSGMDGSICIGGPNDNRTCDCSYYGNLGGCIITKPAPSGTACMCRHTSADTCYGYVVPCLPGEEENDKCKNPDLSEASCKMGAFKRYPDGKSHNNCASKFYLPYKSVDAGGECRLTHDVCKNNMKCGRKSREDSSYACCEHGTGTWGSSQYCRKAVEIGEPCYFDDQCTTNECETFSGLDVSICVSYDCECDYSSGGCEIVKPAPRAGLACTCRYMDGWTCEGYVTKCYKGRENHDKCQNPDTSYESCQMGDIGNWGENDASDCGGY